MMIHEKNLCGTGKDKLEVLERLRALVLPRLESAGSNEFYKNPVNSNPMTGFITDCQFAALISYHIDQNFCLARKYFYVAELAWLKQYFEYQKGSETVLSSPLPSGFHSPLSGNVKLREYLCALRPHKKSLDERLAQKELYIKTRLQQAANIGDLVEVNKLIETYIKMTKKVIDGFQIVLDFYEALCTKDELKVEEALAKVLEPKWVRKTNLHYKQGGKGQFMGHPGMWLAKIAWVNGYEIEIDHPVILSKLLPDAPDGMQFENNLFDFLIDPLKIEVDLKAFDIDMEPQSIEQHNQSIYQKYIFG